MYLINLNTSIVKFYFEFDEDEQSFRDHDIDGETLLFMAELAKTNKEMIVEIMKTQLKVSVVGHQLKLLKLLLRMQI
jgi:hypothetical protein